jgi:hypothetical protein
MTTKLSFRMDEKNYDIEQSLNMENYKLAYNKSNNYNLSDNIINSISEEKSYIGCINNNCFYKDTYKEKEKDKEIKIKTTEKEFNLKNINNNLNKNKEINYLNLIIDIIFFIIAIILIINSVLKKDSINLIYLLFYILLFILIKNII